MVLQILFCIAVLLGTFLICRPFDLFWDRTLDASCGDAANLYISTHIIVLILDVSIAALPMPVLWRLKMAMAKKIGVSILLGIGIMSAGSFPF